ncbi:hypothetical protein ACFFX0_10130 [Citricoccus parietis]|uniref:Uncharacterized protein n=1 Tax=Citricoccus parietis TaxID=592307 RepID=A0ABV5FXX4_9MICC
MRARDEDVAKLRFKGSNLWPLGNPASGHDPVHRIALFCSDQWLGHRDGGSIKCHAASPIPIVRSLPHTGLR